jgi:hypothetical protein
MTERDSQELALLVTEHLRGLSSTSLGQYLQSHYELDESYGLSVNVVHAIEVASGNLLTGSISSVPVRFWEIRNEKCRLIPYVNMRPFNDANDLGRLWPIPIVSYYSEFPHVLVKEGIGSLRVRGNREILLAYYRLLTVDNSQGRLALLSQDRGWLFKR